MVDIPFDKIVLVEEAPYLKKPFAFHIEIQKRKHYYLRAENQNQLDSWIQALQTKSKNSRVYVKPAIPSSNPPSRPRVLLPENDPYVLPIDPKTSAGGGIEKSLSDEIKEEEYMKQKATHKELFRKVEREFKLEGSVCTINISKAENMQKPNNPRSTFTVSLILLITNLQ